MKEVRKFSVVICVYCKDNPNDFECALKSIINQTVIPAEINVVCDGPLTNELDYVIDDYCKKYKIINVYRLKKNQGHGNARKIGIEKSKYDLIALMDSDDISVNNRFEMQLEMFNKNSELSVVGGQIFEFADNINNIVGKRELPEDDQSIKKYMKKRCPMNQVTVMFRKRDVIDSGNYIDWYCEEDYYLWIRMIEKGYKFYNIQKNLVFVRVNNGMYGRRGGLKYYKSEKRVQKYMLDHKLIGFFRYEYNIHIRFIAEVLISNSLRGFLYNKLLRTK